MGARHLQQGHVIATDLLSAHHAAETAVVTGLRRKMPEGERFLPAVGKVGTHYSVPPQYPRAGTYRAIIRLDGGRQQVSNVAKAMLLPAGGPPLHLPAGHVNHLQPPVGTKLLGLNRQIACRVAVMLGNQGQRHGQRSPKAPTGRLILQLRTGRQRAVPSLQRIDRQRIALPPGLQPVALAISFTGSASVRAGSN